MLPMDYFDRDGNKWSIETGDWKSHQSQSPENKRHLPKFKVGGFALLLVLLAVVIAFITIY